MGRIKRGPWRPFPGYSMQFDDRLATVLRMRISSAAGERTQLRQLLDLLGTASPLSGSDVAFARLDELRGRIPADEQARILREPGLRLRNPRLVEFLAGGPPKIAAAALATARLSEAQWEVMIPRLPITARGLLRHRRDLPRGALRQLEQLGVGDLVLSDNRAAQPAAEPGFADAVLPAQSTLEEPATAPSPLPATELSQPRLPPLSDPASQPIGDIIERIEQFRTARRIPVLAPRLPLGDAVAAETAQIEAFDAVTDAQGRAIWATASVAPWIVGMALTSARPGMLVRISDHSAEALRYRQPLRAQWLQLAGAPAIAGDWRIDAAPVFAADSGAFCGYRCRLLRAIPAEPMPDAAETYADRMRQVLHELRTPVNAIQGFAEIIQQQMFGPVPHEYRAHAAAIAVDAARLLAGFEDLERLAQLEAGSPVLEAGESDLRLAVEETLRRLSGVLAARAAGFAVTVEGTRFALPLAPAETLALCWRVLASATGALAPDEQVALRLTGSEAEIRLELDLPAALHGPESATRTSTRTAVSAGMFGPQFAFRLAAAEANAAGGTLGFAAQTLVLTLPVLALAVLTASGNPHSRSVDAAGS